MTLLLSDRSREELFGFVTYPPGSGFAYASDVIEFERKAHYAAYSCALVRVAI